VNLPLLDSLDAYLGHYYQTADQFAAACGISAEELATLVSENLIPKASYTVVRSDRLISQAFGEIRVQDVTPGQYFHPGNATWVARAMATRRAVGPQQANRDLKERFTANFAAALKELDRTIFRLQDSFTDSGDVIAEGLDARTESAWTSYLSGVFSLCVADPSTELSIARKEVLQEALTEINDRQPEPESSEVDKQKILELVEQYARASMPFSPPEYPRSSRKRLVEDLGARLRGV
jgi:hypothetical protein